MGRQIIWSPEALELLEGILNYWEEKNGSKAYSLKLHKLFQECIKQVAKYPESGRTTKYILSPIHLKYKQVNKIWGIFNPPLNASVL